MAENSPRTSETHPSQRIGIMSPHIKSNIASSLATGSAMMIIGWIWKSDWRWAATGIVVLAVAMCFKSSAEVARQEARKEEVLTRSLEVIQRNQPGAPPEDPAGASSTHHDEVKS